MSESLQAIEKLTARNFPGWGLHIKNYLTLKGWAECLAPFVIIEGENPATAADRRARYNENDAKARASMLLAMEQSRALQYDLACPTAAALWTTLQNVHNDSSAANYIKLIESLTSFKMEHNEALTAYVGRATVIKDALKSAGREKSDEEICIYILQGLPPAYETAKQFLLMNAKQSPLTTDMVLQALLPFEARLPQPRGYWTAEPGNGQRNGQRNGRNNRNTGKKQAKAPQADDSEQRICFECGQRGHIKANCPTLKGKTKSGGRGNQAAGDSRPPGKPLAFVTSETTQETTEETTEQLVEETALMTDVKPFTWFLDTAATGHVTPDINDLDPASYVAAPPEQYLHGLNGKIRIAGRGTALLSSGLPGEPVQLLDVIHAPEAGARLVSVPRFLSKGAAYHSTSARATILYDGDPILTTSLRSGGIFCAAGHEKGEWAAVAKRAQQPDQQQPEQQQKQQPEQQKQQSEQQEQPPQQPDAQPSPALPAPPPSPALIAHRKTAHASIHTLERIVNTGMVHGLGITSRTSRELGRSSAWAARPARPTGCRHLPPLPVRHSRCSWFTLTSSVPCTALPWATTAMPSLSWTTTPEPRSCSCSRPRQRLWQPSRT